MKGLVFDIQRFSIHDGPGIRTTVFLKGCSLRCFWCQNPEGIRPEREVQFVAEKCTACGRCADLCEKSAHLVERGRHVFLKQKCIACGRCTEACFLEALVMTGYMLTVQEVIDEVLRDRVFYARSRGGVTLSGGEPLVQRDFSRAILEACKAEGLHTAIETAANCAWTDLEMLLPSTDLIMMDIKHMNTEKHRTVTGVPNDRILDNARRLSRTNKAIVIRVPVVPTVNDSPTEVEAIAEFVHEFRNLQYLELVPFHQLGEGKYRNLCLDYAALNLKAPPQSRMTDLAERARRFGVRVRVG